MASFLCLLMSQIHITTASQKVNIKMKLPNIQSDEHSQEMDNSSMRIRFFSSRVFVVKRDNDLVSLDRRQNGVLMTNNHQETLKDIDTMVAVY